MNYLGLLTVLLPLGTFYFFIGAALALCGGAMIIFLATEAKSWSLYFSLTVLSVLIFFFISSELAFFYTGLTFFFLVQAMATAMWFEKGMKH